MNAENAQNLKTVSGLAQALYDFDEKTVCALIDRIVAADAACHFSHPLGDIAGAQLYEQLFCPLAVALPDLERRDSIVVAGTDDEGASWVGCAGSYVGVFCAPYLNIPPTGHLVHLRYHEFYRLEAGKIVEIQAIWDIPELMMQAGVWPMGPSLGRDWHVPGPNWHHHCQHHQTTQESAEDDGKANKAHIIAMLDAMRKYPLQGGEDIMEMDRFWHPHFSWYGPAGIGSMRGTDGFRRWHQIPFLKAMPDRGQYPDQVKHHFFAEGAFVAVTGWPNMCQTLTGDGWLGIVPSGQRVYLRSLDFWRFENGLIRENWVLVDLLDLWAQLGVDVMARMMELACARPSYDLAMSKRDVG